MATKPPARLARNAATLERLNTSRAHRRILERADDDLLLCLSDCVTNILRGNVLITPAEHRLLERHKKMLRALCQASPKKIRDQLRRQAPKLLRAIVRPALALLDAQREQ